MSDEKKSEQGIPRRTFLTGAGVAGAAAATLSVPLAEPAKAQQAPAADPRSEQPLILNPTENAFIQAAVDTFIPADALSPSGTDCGIAVFIDRELAGAYGRGARLYRSGPFFKGKPEHGYQLPLTPYEFFRAGIADANAWTRKSFGKEFDRLTPAQRDEALKAMDAGKAEFTNAKMFFEQLYAMTMEGFFADPIYGGNRDKVSWKMIGYPGLPAAYGSHAAEYRGKKLNLEPKSIADFS
jgi:gluconate 2-dehydrogenase gamma chain